MASRVAAYAFVSTFRERNLVPSDLTEWDSEGARFARYALGDHFYANTVYSSAHANALKLRIDYGLYKHIRSIYSPVHRLVEFYVAAVYGGNLDFENLEKGAVPILMADDALKTAIRQTWLWSNWRSQKNVYVRTGTRKGDVFLWIADEVDRQKVRLEVVDPMKVRDYTPDAVGNVKDCVLEYQLTDPDTNRDYTFRLEVDQDWFRPFRDNTALEAWPNPYGFVPLVHTKHIDVGMQYGAYAFHGTEGKIDEANDAASILNDAVRKAVNIIYYGAGMARNQDLDANVDARDVVPIITGPKDTELKPLTPQVDIAAAGGNLDRMLKQLETDMPELSLHQLRDSGNLTAPGVRAGYKDAIDRVQEAQGNYDDGYIRAQKMAITIGGFRGYEGFEGFNLDSFPDDVEFYVKERPVIDDSLSLVEKLQQLVALNNVDDGLLEIGMSELDYDNEAIGKVLTARNNARERAQAQLDARNATPGDDEGDDDDADTLPGFLDNFERRGQAQLPART